MSNCNNQICRDSYFNYGSYLRSRGYDKEICNLVTAIENGEIPIGGLIPGPGGIGLTVTGDLTVNASNTNGFDGRVLINGGSWGSGTGSAIQSVPASMLSLQVAKGAHINGPIIQNMPGGTGPPSVNNVTGTGAGTTAKTNLFSANYHVFQGPSDPAGPTGTTNVVIKGQLIIDGSGYVATDELAETLTLETVPTFPNLSAGEPDVMLRLFPAHLTTGTAPAQGKDLADIWLDSSTNIISSNYDWTANTGLAFAVDGQEMAPGQQYDASYGGTAIPGHTRILRGLTATSIPLTNLDISYAVDAVDLSSISVDAYGTIRIGEGPTYAGTTKAPGNLDLSGGDIRFYRGDAATGLMGYIDNTGAFTDLSMGRGYFKDLSAGEFRVIGDSRLSGLVHCDAELRASYIEADSSLNVLDHARIGNGAGGTYPTLEVDAGSGNLALGVIGDSSFNNVYVDGTLSVTGASKFDADVRVSAPSGLYVGKDISMGYHLYVGNSPGGPGGNATIYQDLSAGWLSGATASSLYVRPPVANPNTGVAPNKDDARIYMGDALATGGTFIPHSASAGGLTTVKIENSTGLICHGSSSLRYKNNIRDLELTDAKRLMNIRAKKFNMKGGSAIPRMGFIAEEFHDAGLQEFVIYDAESRPDGINYEEITAPLLEIARDNLNRVILLEGELKAAKERIAALEKK